MKKNAVIYVRTSSERQGEKSSPIEQEADCRKLAAEQGLTVVNVYKDIERYRVKNKIIDPSGTRADRPGLLAMLGDAAQGGFDVILAWREDRLYRGMRAMLMVLETIQEYKITVMLARETFDPKIAPLKAWVAQMELEGIKERMAMGVKARLRAGKANAGQDRYGYRRNGGSLEVVEEEAKWVRQIFAWYNQHVPLMEIRRRLIEANAPQKGGPTPRRMEWNRNVISGILESANEYARGWQEQSRAGETFNILSEPILDLATYETALSVRQANKNHPARHVRQNYLIGGLLYCACGRKWGARTNLAMRRDQAGQPVAFGRYYCTQPHADRISPDCPRTIGSTKADAIVWEKVCAAINQPEILLVKARQTITELQNSASALSDEQERIQKELDALTLERQWVITQARKKALTESDMDYQLGALTLQELTLKRDLASISVALDVNSLHDWETRIGEYFADLQAGIESLNIAPEDEEERQEIFEIKRQIVSTLVSRVTIDRERNLHVDIRINLQKIFNADPSQKDDDPDDRNERPEKPYRKYKDKIKTTGIYPGRCDDSRPTAAFPRLRKLAGARPPRRHDLARLRTLPHPPRRPQTNPPRM